MKDAFGRSRNRRTASVRAAGVIRPELSITGLRESDLPLPLWRAMGWTNTGYHTLATWPIRFVRVARHSPGRSLGWIEMAAHRWITSAGQTMQDVKIGQTSFCGTTQTR